MQHLETQKSNSLKASQGTPEARYRYYRRCQLFRRNGEQCKAPAEKGEQICHAHAAQLAMAARRERERQAVLAEAVAEMRKRGKPEYGITDLFTDFKGIQVMLAVVAKALITGSIDCKTAGQMLVQLQTMSKLLWMIHRKTNIAPLINTDDADQKKLPKSVKVPRIAERENPRPCATMARCVDETAVPRVSKLGVIALMERSRAHGPPGLIAA
jgi:hypothetical protein